MRETSLLLKFRLKMSVSGRVFFVLNIFPFSRFELDDYKNCSEPVGEVNSKVDGTPSGALHLVACSPTSMLLQWFGGQLGQGATDGGTSGEGGRGVGAGIPTGNCGGHEGGPVAGHEGRSRMRGAHCADTQRG